MAGGDFFLKFGSDAEPFSNNLVKQLGPGIKSIQELIAALDTYDSAAARTKTGGSPLGSILTSLDDVGAKFASLTGEMGGAMSSALRGFQDLRKDLSLLVDEINKLPTASRTAGGRTKKVNVAAIAGVSDQDVAAASTQGKKVSQTNVDNATAVRNAMKRVGDINGTVARNAGLAADALSKLGEQIRGLTTKTKTSTRGIEQGSFQQVVIVQQGVGGGAAIHAAPTGGGAAVNVDQLLQAVGVAASTPTAEAARVERVKEQNARYLSQADLAGPAQPGRFYLRGPNGEENRTIAARRSVGFQINPDESFNEYFARQKANQAAEAKIDREIQKRSEQRLGSISQAAQFGDAQKRFSSAELDKYLEPQTREAFTAPGAVSGGDLQTAIARVKALTPNQGLGGPEELAQLPHILDDYQKRQVDSEELRRAHVEQVLAANPNETFAGASKATQRILAQIDEGRDDTGSRLRDEQRAKSEAASADRQALAGARRDLEYAGRSGVIGLGGTVIGTSEEAVENSKQQQAAIKEKANSEVEKAKRAVAEDNVAALREQFPAAVKLKPSEELLTARANVTAAQKEAKAARDAIVQSAIAANPDQSGEVRRALPGYVPTEEEAATLQNAQKKLDLLKAQRNELELAHKTRQDEAQAEQGIGRRTATVVSGAEVSGIGPAVAGLTDVVEAATNETKARVRRPRGSQSDIDTDAGLRARLEEEAEVKANAKVTAAGGGGKKPPRPPAPPAAPGEEPDESANTNARRSRAGTGRTGAAIPESSMAGIIARLSEETREVLADTKAWLENATAAERAAGIRDRVTEAGAALKRDPFYAATSGFRGIGGLSATKGVLGGALGLDPRANFGLLTDVLTNAPGGTANALNIARANVAAKQTSATAGAGAVPQADFSAIKALAGDNETLYQALLRQIGAQERLNKLRASSTATTESLARAEAELSAATVRVAAVQEAAAPKTWQQKVFGTQGFAASQLRHIGSGLENIIGYQLVFSGFEKLRELVTEGTQADLAFVRLQASLKANGEEVGGLRTALTGIASSTASSLTDVSHAAADLVGVFHNVGDLAFGTKIAAQLANISQGSLTATQAATALRDVIDAYGITGAQAVQAVGDQIASLSQKTGVPIGDITQATAKLAPEAKEFGLTQRQASTLAAYTIQATGQSGESSAEQVSRILATVNSGAAQKALTRAGIATDAQYQRGDTAGVITNLMSKFHELPEATQRSISALLGAGRQAATFAALMQNGATAVAEMNGTLNDQGALARQNAAFLNSFAGAVKQLNEDFQQIGVTLYRLGAFDALGVLAKSMDTLFRTFNLVFGTIADFFDKNPITKGLLHIGVALLEVTLAFKLLGGAAATALGKIGIGKAVNTAESLAASAAVRAGVAGAEEVPLRYAPFTARGAVTGLLNTPQRLAQNVQGRYINARYGTALPGIAALNTAPRPFTLTPPGSSGVASEALRGEQEVSRLSRAMAGMGAAAQASSGALSRAVQSIGGFNLAMIGAVIGFSIFQNALAEDKKRNAQAQSIIDSNGFNPSKPAGSDPNSPEQQAADALAGIHKGRSLLGEFAHAPGQGITGVAEGIRGLFGAGNNGRGDQLLSQGDYGDAVGKQVFGVQSRAFGYIRAAIKSNDPKQVIKAQEEIDTEFDNQYKVLSKGLDKQAKAQLANDLGAARNSINTIAIKNQTMAAGFVSISGAAMAAAATLASAFGAVSLSTIRATAAVNAAQVESAATYAAGTKEAAALQELSTGQVQVPESFGPYPGISLTTPATTRQLTYQESLKDQQFLAQSQLATDQAKLEQKDAKGNLLIPPTTVAGDQYNTIQANITQQRSILDTTSKALLTTPIAASSAQATLEASQGKNSEAITTLKSNKDQLSAYLATLDRTQPEYWTTLQAITTDNAQIATIMASPIINQLAIEAAGTLDETKKAHDATQSALATLSSSYDESGTPGTPGYGKLVVDPSVEAQRQATATAAGLQENVVLPQAKAQAAYDALTAQDALTGDAVKGASDAYDKASQQYTYAIANYASDSVEVRQAYAAKVTASLNVFQATLADTNSKLQLAEAQLTAKASIGNLSFDKTSGKFTGQTDLATVAQDKAREAQNAIDSFHAHGGKDNTDQGRKLAGDLASAQRAAFDQQLNDQLDLLDFQQQTYKITSAQEVNALLQILSNKKLTLAEQQKITLQIKNLQDKIRQELTGSGFNIPSNITLPTAYEVRRSLGAGFNGAGSTAQIVSNSTSTANIVINNNVPTAAVANAIAAQVINQINANTNNAVRANSSTPRLVPTR